MVKKCELKAEISMPTGFAVSLGKMNWIAFKHWKKSTIEVQSLATLANTEKVSMPPETWDKLDAIRADKSRGHWIAEQVRNQSAI